MCIYFFYCYYDYMNFYQKKLQEQKDYLFKKPADKKDNLKKTKMDKMRKPKKNAQLGMF